jgi:hypothetical protein
MTKGVMGGVAGDLATITSSGDCTAAVLVGCEQGSAGDEAELCRPENVGQSLLCCFCYCQRHSGGIAEVSWLVWRQCWMSGVAPGEGVGWRG